MKTNEGKQISILIFGAGVFESFTFERRYLFRPAEPPRMFLSSFLNLEAGLPARCELPLTIFRYSTSLQCSHWHAASLRLPSWRLRLPRPR